MKRPNRRKIDRILKNEPAPKNSGSLAQVLLDRVNEVLDDPASATQRRLEWIVQTGPEVEKTTDGKVLVLRVKTSKMRFVIER
jgi:hypothetical protein